MSQRDDDSAISAMPSPSSEASAKATMVTKTVTPMPAATVENTWR